VTTRIFRFPGGYWWAGQEERGARQADEQAGVDADDEAQVRAREEREEARRSSPYGAAPLIREHSRSHSSIRRNKSVSLATTCG
jgi:hypothetical protein